MAQESDRLLSPAIIMPTRMLEFRAPSMALDPRSASDCRNVTIKNGILKKRTGFSAFSIDDAGNTNIPGRVTGLCQSPFGWNDDIVALSQNATNTQYFLYDTDEKEWNSKDSEAQTAYSQLSWCPAVQSDGTDVVILSDNKVRLKIWENPVTGPTIGDLGLNSFVLRAKVVRYYKGHLCLFNVGTYTSSWTQEKRRIQWTISADCEDIDGAGSGSNYLYGRRGGYIVGAEEHADDMIIYCEHEILRMTHVGGTGTFRFDPLVAKIGLAAQNAIANLGDRHLFLADDFTVQEFAGGLSCNPVGDPINSDIQTNIHKTYYGSSFFVTDTGLNEAWLFIPTTTYIPDTVYVIKYGGCLEGYRWYKDSKSGFCGMEHDNWDVLVGTGTPTIDHYNHSATNDGATAIDAYWNSISFTLPQEPSRFMRAGEIRFEGKGDAVTTYYRTTDGGTWTKIADHTLTSSFAYYSAPFDPGYARSIQFRFRNNTASEDFEIKWWQPVFLPKGAR